MLKSANLLHKCGLGDSDMSSTVQELFFIVVEIKVHTTTTLKTMQFKYSLQVTVLLAKILERLHPPQKWEKI